MRREPERIVQRGDLNSCPGIRLEDDDIAHEWQSDSAGADQVADQLTRAWQIQHNDSSRQSRMA
jgi:hypothetical protein